MAVLGLTPTASSPIPLLTTTTAGLLEVTWPDGRPESFAITPDLFELVIAEINQHRVARAAAQAERAAANGQPAAGVLGGVG